MVCNYAQHSRGESALSAGMSRLCLCATHTGIRVVCALLVLISTAGLAEAADPVFTDFTAEMGLSESYFSWNVYGPGVAAVDFDGDEDLDLCVAHDEEGIRIFRNDPEGLVNVAPSLGLDYRVELPPLEDRTHPGALDYSSMMPTFLDLDNDGDRDFFLTCWNSYCRLYENNGDGTFTDLTDSTALDIVGRTATAAFADYSGNGRLDVYLVGWGERDRLFKNVGDLEFKDASSSGGVHEPVNPARAGWCAIWYYQNNDRFLDLYVGNDYGQPNFLFLNLGNSTFLEYSSTCFPDFEPNASMGQALGDFDRDRDYDLYVANSLLNNFYRYDRVGGIYVDLAVEGAPITRTMKDERVGWFCDWPDVDNDGWVDLFLVNGYIPLCSPLDPGYPQDCGGDQRQKNRLWMNREATSFVDASQSSGLNNKDWGRAAAISDFDMDGDLDIYVTNNNGNHKYYRNDTESSDHWLVVRLVGTRGNRDAVGAQVEVDIGDVVLMRDRWAGTGYLSQTSDEIHFGLGEAEVVDRLRVRWPNGETEEWEQVPADQRIVLAEGSSQQGSRLPAPPELALENANGGVRMTWTVEGEAAPDEFVVYRNLAGHWAAMLHATPGEPGVFSYEYLDQAVEPERAYEYRVMARTGGVSVTSARVALETEPGEPAPAVVRSERGPRPVPRPETFSPDVPSGAPPRPALHANVPNPFNPGTVLPYAVPGNQAKSVRLRIYDSAGRQVADLVNETRAPGGHEVPWDGRDLTGRPVTSGVYHARLEIAGYDAVHRKLTLVR